MRTIKSNYLQKKMATVFAFIVLSAVSMNTYAEDSVIRFSNNAYKQVIAQDNEGNISYDYVNPKLVLPDDVILYEIIFENISQQAVSNIVVNNPIANNSIYRESSVTGDSTEVTFSVDGKKFAAENVLTVKNAKGKIVNAKAKDYTAIRWIYKNTLKPGEKGKVTYKTTIK